MVTGLSREGLARAPRGAGRRLSGPTRTDRNSSGLPVDNESSVSHQTVFMADMADPPAASDKNSGLDRRKATGVRMTVHHGLGGKRATNSIRSSRFSRRGRCFAASGAG